MNLDNPAAYPNLDASDLLANIDALPDWLLTSWINGQELVLPAWHGIHQVICVGMGDSGLGAELLVSYAAPILQVPVVVLRDYELPSWAAGEQTLVVAISHSGGTEECLAAFQQALAQGCRCLAMCEAGELAAAAQAAGTALWRFEAGSPSSAVAAMTFGLLAAVLHRFDLLPDLSAELQQAVQSMHRQQEQIRAQVPATANSAKRMAMQMMGRWVTIFGAGFLEPVARRWKIELNKVAKTWAQYETLPEANHNTILAVCQPEHALPGAMLVFLRAASSHPRNRQRTDLTKRGFMLEGMGTDFVDAQGETRLAQQWTCLHYGDYVAYYLAMAYDVDAGASSALVNFKQDLGTAG